MEGHELLGKVNKVVAPPSFEGRVMSRLGEEKRARIRRQSVTRYAFAGSAAVLVVGILLLNPLAIGRRSAPAPVGNGRAAVVSVRRGAEAPLSVVSGPRTAYLPVLETVDYSSEMRNASYQPRTVYILEQVSEDRPTQIKY